MISYNAGQSLFQTLSQNLTAANASLYGQLANIEQRYLLQKYFANEGSYSITTIGAQNLTATGTISLGATSATLTSAWTFQTVQAQVTFSDGEYRMVNFINGSTAITWTGALTAAVTSALAIGGVQFYPFPPNYSKLKDITITVGNLKWTLDEIRTREQWDKINVFPYYADIPKNFFIYPGGDRGGQVGIWPIPSTTGNIITYNYKFRVPDLSFADYNTDTTTGMSITGAGTVSLTNGSTAVTGTSTAFTPTTNAQLESRWLRVPQPSGDNLWYQIQSINSTTGITLYQPYQGITVTGATYTVGQMPLIAEDFQDMLVFKSLAHYFKSIVDNPTKREEYEEEYDKKLSMLNEYSGSNTVQVNLSRRYQNRNPNVYPYGNLG